MDYLYEKGEGSTRFYEAGSMKLVASVKHGNDWMVTAIKEAIAKTEGATLTNRDTGQVDAGTVDQLDGEPEEKKSKSKKK